MFTITMVTVVTNMKVAESLLFVRLSEAARDLTSWPSGLRVWLRDQRTWMRTYFQCIFLRRYLLMHK